MTDLHWHLPYMTSGERVLWQTEPEKRRLSFRWIAAGAIALMTALTIPAGMLLCDVFVRHGSPPALSVIASVLAALWLWLLMGQGLYPLLLRQVGRRHPEFVVTDRRILRNRGGMVDAVLLHQLPEATLTPEADGTATLTFWPNVAHNPERDSGRANLGSLLGFSIPHIQQADRLQAIMQDARVKHERATPLAEAPLIPLEPGETLLWQGQPARRRSLQQRLSGRYIATESGSWAIGLWIMLMVAGFMTMVILEVGWQRDMWPMYLLLSGVMAVGIALTLAPLRRGRRQTRQTDYVLTDRRVLRRIDGFVSELRLDLPTPLMIYLAHGRGGCATLMLATLPTIHGGKTITLSDASAPMEGFQLRDIPDAARVADLIAARQAAA